MTVNELIVLINAMRRLTVKADLQVMVNGRPAPFDSSPLFPSRGQQFCRWKPARSLVYLDLASPAALSFHFTPNTHTSCRLGAFCSVTLVERVLATAIGEEGTAWWTDAITDRLFTYVTVHVRTSAPAVCDCRLGYRN